jgi:hypothetical protein
MSHPAFKLLIMVLAVPIFMAQRIGLTSPTILFTSGKHGDAMVRPKKE